MCSLRIEITKKNMLKRLLLDKYKVYTHISNMNLPCDRECMKCKLEGEIKYLKAQLLETRINIQNIL
jgi:hypothetical protein